MPRPSAFGIVLTTSTVLLTTSLLSAADWPNWRGPEQNGVSRESRLPVAWGEDAAVAWKCELPPWGNSTPVTWGDAIFLTSQTDDGKLLLVRIGKKTGRIEWTQQVGNGTAERVPLFGKSGEARRHQKFHEIQNFASPSAVTDGEVVVAHFGNGDLAAYDLEGKRLWGRDLQKDHGEYTVWWGHANSPVLYQDLVVSVCMQDSCSDLPGRPSPSYVVAHDKRTGEERWFVPRPTEAQAESCDAYTTPLLWTRGGKTDLVVMGGQILDAYDPLSGKRTWWFPRLVGNRVITGPVATEDTLYVTQGMRQAMLALRPDGRGEQTRAEIVWKCGEGTPDSPTPVVWGELLFLVTDNGIARCLDARTGQLKWKERLKGDYLASPLAAEGRIYFLNMKGLTTVVSASSRFDRLTENRLDDETLASPIVSDGKIYIRGKKRLYCIGR